MSDELHERIRRIYAALGETIEEDLAKFTPTVIENEHGRVIIQDFRGGLSPEQISNIAHSSIHNLASLADHLRGWARRNSKDVKLVDAAIDSSFELQVIIDLWNVEKHGPPRDGGRSGRSPKLAEVNRVMRLTAGPAPQSAARVTFNPGPTLHVVGAGRGDVVVTGTIVDGAGAVVGDLHGFMEAALAAWIAVLRNFGIAV
jgi:hypothetical protein